MTDKIDVNDPEPGVFEDVPMDVYHEIDAASNTRLSKLRQSPAHLRAYLDKEEEETKALRLGRIIHKAVLEPELFEDQFTVLGACQATKGSGEPCTNSAKYVTPDGQLCGVHGDAEDHDESVNVVKDSEMETARGIQESVEQSPPAREMIMKDPGVSEYTMIWEEPDVDGLICKARIDRYAPHVPGDEDGPDGAAVDLKTTRDASPESFRKAIFNYGYFRQAAHYLRGAEVLGRELGHFVIVAAEKNPPYGVRTYRVSDGLTDDVIGQLKDLYHLYAACMEHDRWPGYPDKVQDISVPGWAKDKIEDQRNEVVEHLRRVETA